MTRVLMMCTTLKLWLSFWTIMARAAAPSPHGTTKADVCFVLDASGSMGGDESGVKAFVRTLASQLDLSPGGSAACVVQFADTATTLTSPAMTSSYSAVSSAVDSYSANGYTNIGDGLTMAKNNLLSRASSGLPQVIVLLSD